mmetsp:Transcript_9230/g.10438  ORF Transcript_9230/g.10438 Transcript_9230/m.10438 type:complete len:138 (+) Transcript_9230:524-937(+)
MLSTTVLSTQRGTMSGTRHPSPARPATCTPMFPRSPTSGLPVVCAGQLTIRPQLCTEADMGIERMITANNEEPLVCLEKLFEPAILFLDDGWQVVVSRCTVEETAHLPNRNAAFFLQQTRGQLDKHCVQLTKIQSWN